MLRLQSSFSKINGDIAADTQADRDKLIFWKSENIFVGTAILCICYLLLVKGEKRARRCVTGTKKKVSAVFLSPLKALEFFLRF